MTNEDNKKVVSINKKNGQNEVIEINEDESAIIVDGELQRMESFVASGTSIDGDRVMLTYNASLDEVVVYKEVITSIVQKELLENIGK